AIRPDHLLSVQADLSSARYRKPDVIRQFTNEILNRLKALPGIDSVTAAEFAPFGGGSMSSVEVEGAEPGQTQPKVILNQRAVLPNYFSVLGMPIIRGRGFTDAESSDNAPVTMINESLARKFWTMDTAINKRIRHSDRWYSVVGIVADLRELDF